MEKARKIGLVTHIMVGITTILSFIASMMMFTDYSISSWKGKTYTKSNTIAGIMPFVAFIITAIACILMAVAIKKKYKAAVGAMIFAWITVALFPNTMSLLEDNPIAWDGYYICICCMIIMFVAAIMMSVFIMKMNRPLSRKQRKEKNKEFEKQAKEDGAIYTIEGAHGRQLAVYEDKVIINTKIKISSIMGGNATDGEKTIYYSDCIGVQYKRVSITFGYLQFETASGLMNNQHDNFLNENTFTWEADKDEIMEKVAKYVKKRIDEFKRGMNRVVAPVVSTTSVSEELLKLSELYKAGAISQEEYIQFKAKLMK